MNEMKRKLAQLQRDCENMEERLGLHLEAELIEWNIREQRFREFQATIKRRIAAGQGCEIDWDNADRYVEQGMASITRLKEINLMLSKITSRRREIDRSLKMVEATLSTENQVGDDIASTPANAVSISDSRGSESFESIAYTGITGSYVIF